MLQSDLSVTIQRRVAVFGGRPGPRFPLVGAVQSSAGFTPSSLGDPHQGLDCKILRTLLYTLVVSWRQPQGVGNLFLGPAGLLPNLCDASPDVRYR